MEKNERIRQLKEKIMELEGFYTPSEGHRLPFGLGPLESAFPRGIFPMGAIHEFISPGMAETASTNGFIAGLLSVLMQKGGFCLWVSNRRTLFPPGLKQFGVEPDRFIFIDAKKEKDVLWTVEQGLRCEALAAVVGELKEISFAESRRLQLAVESSRVTGFLHRHQPRNEGTLACATRWKIMSMSSKTEEGIPGVGFPRWRVELVKVRNGRPGVWQLEWKEGAFRYIPFSKGSGEAKKKQRYA
ncbi:ImuA family protein [Negadavirga shengliensis]|uniref:ImuA family protein n=1 Tax=Negadavirga shengliensis TaxID=1389218 RepID=A0ABV9T359_9BACT